MITKKPWIIGNLKMNMGIKEIATYIQTLNQKLPKSLLNKMHVVIVPPFTLLRYCFSLVKLLKLDVHIGSQNFFYESKGAYTGEVSIKMLQDLKIKYALVGHSERRTHFSESNEIIQKKVEAALNYNITPILCIGESIEEKALDLTEEKLSMQLKIALNPLLNKSFDLASKICIAYEPIWAIGLRGYLDIKTVQKSILLIQSILSKIGLSESTIKSIPIFYGGSTYEGNIESIMEQLPIDGILVGRASLSITQFIQCAQVLASKTK